MIVGVQQSELQVVRPLVVQLRDVHQVVAHVAMTKELHAPAGMMKDQSVTAMIDQRVCVVTMTDQVDQVQVVRDVMMIVRNVMEMKNQNVGNGQVNVQRRVMIANAQDDQVVADQAQVDQVSAGMIAHVEADQIVLAESLLDEIVMNVHQDTFRKNAST